MSSLKDKREQLNIRQHTSFSGSLLFKGRSKHIDEPKNLKQIIKKKQNKISNREILSNFSSAASSNKFNLLLSQ